MHTEAKLTMNSIVLFLLLTVIISIKIYISAKANYQQALTVKPNEAYPKEMIGKADNQIAGLEANAKFH